MYEPEQDDSNIEPERPARTIGRAATGLLLLKIAAACGFSGFVLVLLAAYLPRNLQLLAILPGMAVVVGGGVLTFGGEVLCLQAPTRLSGRRWIQGLILSKAIIAPCALWDSEHQRYYSGLQGLLIAGAMYQYLSDLASQFGRPEVHTMLRRFAISTLVGGCAMAAARELQSHPQVFVPVLTAALFALSQGMRAYWSALTELRTTLLAADAVAKSLPEGLTPEWQEVAEAG